MRKELSRGGNFSSISRPLGSLHEKTFSVFSSTCSNVCFVWKDESCADLDGLVLECYVIQLRRLAADPMYA